MSASNGMDEVTIYRYQLDAIQDALRLASNIHDSQRGETCFDRCIRQSKQFAENAQAGEYKRRVNYITGKNNPKR
jgi:hypothetical protein